MNKKKSEQVSYASKITAAAIDKYLRLNGWTRNHEFPNRNMMVYTNDLCCPKTLAIPASEEYEDFCSAVCNAIRVLANKENRSEEEIAADILNCCENSNNSIRSSELSQESQEASQHSRRSPVSENEINMVTVRWHDGYLEEFEAVEVRSGSDLLFMRLTNGCNRHIPLRSVRWFGLSKESHQTQLKQEA